MHRNGRFQEANHQALGHQTQCAHVQTTTRYYKNAISPPYPNNTSTMSRESLSSLEKRSLSEPIKQAFMLLAILKEFLYLLLPLLRENVSLEDVQSRLEVLKADCVVPSDGARSSSPISLASDVQSESTCSGSERPQSAGFVSAAQKLCRAIVQRDTKAISR